jgi:periplasmic protein TonB
MAMAFNRWRGMASAAAAVLAPLACLSLPQAALAADMPAHVDATVQNPQPPYPDTAQINGEQGNVEVSVRVGANGKIRGISVTGSSGFEDLDNAAVEGVLRWHFVPAVEDGDTATAWTKVNVVFQLPKAPVVSPPGPAH